MTVHQRLQEARDILDVAEAALHNAVASRSPEKTLAALAMHQSALDAYRSACRAQLLEDATHRLREAQVRVDLQLARAEASGWPEEAEGAYLSAIDDYRAAAVAHQQASADELAALEHELQTMLKSQTAGRAVGRHILMKLGRVSTSRAL